MLISVCLNLWLADWYQGTIHLDHFPVEFDIADAIKSMTIASNKPFGPPREWSVLNLQQLAIIICSNELKETRVHENAIITVYSLHDSPGAIDVHSCLRFFVYDFTNDSFLCKYFLRLLLYRSPSVDGVLTET